MNDWIPVKKRKPEENTDVLAYSEGYFYVATYRGNNIWEDDYGYNMNPGPEAWMPLPEPYEEGKP